MTFQSILFSRPADRIPDDAAEVPSFFADLNLGQIVDAITFARQEYNLVPFFYTPLRDLDAIYYRHEVMQDLEIGSLLEHVRRFAQGMRNMREHLARADKVHYKYEKESWFLDAVEIYCRTVSALAEDLSRAELRSRGFLAFHEYLIAYVGSPEFEGLVAETQKLKADLATVRYTLQIKGDSVTVRKYENEADYSTEVEETFKKFQQGAVKNYLVKLSDSSDMNHIEAAVLDLVAKLYPEIFSHLDTYRAEREAYADKVITVFDREIQFYVAYLEHMAAFRRVGLSFCYPVIADTSKAVWDHETFDLALAYKLTAEKSAVVCNDFYLKDRERIFVVSGPNQGGKTTFARTVGQLHYLARLGCPVPGRDAQLFLCDRLFTHFEREEDIANLRGKLHDDLVRVHAILEHATPRSLIIMNEIFTSTTLRDALFLSKRIMERLIELDVLGVWVTFVDELASFAEQTVSMVSTVVPEDPTVRTFKLVRKPADGMSYAMSIAEKHRLTYARLKERLPA